MVSSLVFVACGCSSFMSTSSGMVSTNTKQNDTKNRGGTAHKALKLMLLSNSYTFLRSTQG
jgi:hypothetical protein